MSFLIKASRSIVISTRSSSYYDAVVVGGGMVGNAMACSLGANKALNGKSILLLDSGAPPNSSNWTDTSIYRNRVVATSPRSIDIFKRLDVWDRISSVRAKRVNRLYVYESCSTSEIEFSRICNNEIAYVIENDVIVGALFEKLQNYKNIDIKSSVKVIDCGIPTALENLATIKLDNGEVIETSLLIGADGVASKVRQSTNVGYNSFSYNQNALVAIVELETAHGRNETGWQRFTPLGTVALIPLSDTVSALTWATTPEDAKRLSNLAEDQFIDELNDALFNQLEQNSFVNKMLFTCDQLNPFKREAFIKNAEGKIPPHVTKVLPNSRAHFPLGFGNAKCYITTRCALIGDAAHKMHPLAGQGVNLGWNDVDILTDVIEKATIQGADIGSLTYLSDYDSRAQRHNMPVMLSVDLLNRLYRTDAPAIVAARSIGLNAFNNMNFIKNFFINYLSVSK